ncbi:hypothetical protein [Bosea sp. 2RAB26]|uniref:hypothetical protein n=1 Tax=Bosea sp. 2RAB26 TaxID=3237476 RepID=UPI003F912819
MAALQDVHEVRRQFGRPYKRAEHQWIADAADELAQEAAAEMVARGHAEADLIFGVNLLMCFASGGPKISVGAIRFDRSYDWDADYKRASESPLTGYAKFSDMPGDVAFRVAGRSMGMFLGGWILLDFQQKYMKAAGTSEPGTTAVVDAIIVSARVVPARSVTGVAV